MTHLACGWEGNGNSWEVISFLLGQPIHVMPSFGVFVILGNGVTHGPLTSEARERDQGPATYLCSARAPPCVPCPDLAFSCLDTFLKCAFLY